MENKAAWITAAKTHPFEVKEAPTPSAGENDVVVRVEYAAVNPIDPMMQDTPFLEVPYPYIFGVDVAGTIISLGSGVTRFQVGQRVIGHCDSFLTGKAERSAFQHYAVLREILVAAVPDALPLANAAVLPLSVSTASSGLFGVLGLPSPSLSPKEVDQTVLIWGGSSSCGSSAIQLAVAAGWKVASTASKSNENYVRDLGATTFFDYKDPGVVDKIAKTLKHGDLVFDCISNVETQTACGEILGKISGGELPITLMAQGTFPDNVTPVPLSGLDPGMVKLDIGDAVWRKFLPQALAVGQLQAKPDPLVIEGGLEKVQEAVDVLRKGVSAKKVVIRLQ